MINLIPPAGHNAVRKEYRMRIGATYAFLFAAVFILLTVSLVPTYVLVRAQMHGFNAQEANQAEGDIKSVEEDMVRTEAILDELRKTPDRPQMSTMVREIESAATPGISFRNFSLRYVKGALDPIVVQGTAARREDLVVLKQTLEAHDLFESATVPLADLAKEQNVPFSITVTLAKTR